VLTIVTLLLLTGLFEKLPEATLAAVVIAAVVELVDISSLRRLYGVYTRRIGRAYGVAARPRFRGRDRGDARGDGVRHAAGPVHRDRHGAAAVGVPRLPSPRGRARQGAGDRRPSTATSRVTRRMFSPTAWSCSAPRRGLFPANSQWARGRVRAAAAR
jgi:Sulfate permease family